MTSKKTAAKPPAKQKPAGKAPARRKPAEQRKTASAKKPAPAAPVAAAAGVAPPPGALAQLAGTLAEIEASRAGGGTVELPGGARLAVTNLAKKLWPALGITKGELMRHYVTVAPCLLPVVEDRPLIMRRFPNGIDGGAFYQQRAPDDPPAGVRALRVAADKEVPSRLVGGGLATLLYMTQIASISQDPWFSRVQSIDELDYAAIDLDPLEGTPFTTVIEVALRVREQLDALGVTGFVKTSGASGMHIYVPMRPGTSYSSGMLFCQMIGTLVARKHPKIATVERGVQKRAAGTVYVDYLQNIRGKSIACAYSARASAFAGVSTPLRWSEVRRGLDPRDFTIRTFAARLRDVGDLWQELRRAPGVDLAAVIEGAATKTATPAASTPRKTGD